MAVDILLFAAAIAVAVLAAILGNPRPVGRDGERLFKVLLSNLLGGALQETSGGEDEAAARALDARWERQVRELVPYHPAGREGWKKVKDPGAYRPPVPHLDGEEALLDALRKVPDARGRVRRMLVEDESGLQVLLDDPERLGEIFHPSTWLAPGLGWEAVSRWDREVVEAVLRQVGHVRVAVVHVEGEARAPGLVAAFGAILPTRGHPVAPDLDPAVLATALLSSLEAPQERLLLMVLGEVGPTVLECLVGAPELRDRLFAVLFMGSPVGGVPGLEGPLSVEARARWNEANFQQDPLDTELRRTTPYLFLPLLDLDAPVPGDGRAPWESQVLDQPPVPPSGRRPVQVVDLGPLTARAQIPPEPLARATLLLVLTLT